MQNEVASSVAERKVVAGQLALLCVECQLVTGKPSLITNDGGGVDQWTGQVDVDITIHANALVRVSCLEASGLLSKFVCKRNGTWRTVNDTPIADGGVA